VGGCPDLAVEGERDRQFGVGLKGMAGGQELAGL
jgi:hypothetical protein